VKFGGGSREEKVKSERISGKKIEPFDFGGKEDIWVLRIHLKGFSYIRPAHGPRRERQVAAFGDKGVDECPEEKNNEERGNSGET